MPRRSSSLTQVVDGAIDREINSKYDDVKKVADSIDDVIIVANATAVAAVVADNIGVVTAVGSNIAAVVDVHNNTTNIATIIDNFTNINTVASNIVDVNDVADSIVAVNTVNDNIAEVHTVVNSIANIGVVAGSIAGVNTVASNMADISTISVNIADVSTAVDNIAQINQVAADTVEIHSIVNTVIPNIVEILQADSNAVIATAQAGLASTARVVAETAKEIAEGKAAEASLSAIAADAHADLAAISESVANTKAGEASASATAAHNSELAAAALLDAFDDIYLGAYTDNPLVGNDGNPLVSGALYFNNVAHSLRVYDAGMAEWIALVVTSFADMRDVLLTSVSTGDMLKWNGSKWINTSPQTTITGNAGTATKLQTARAIQLSGAVTGTADFDGETAIDIVTTNTAAPVITLAGDATGSVTLTNLSSGTLTVNIVDDSHDHVISNIDGLQTAIDAKVDDAEKGVANGIATLDANGKVVLSQINDSILGQLEYKGVWNLATMPTATEKGQYWVASVAGNGYEVGDWAVYNGTTFDKVDNTDAVASVAGRTGVVVLTKTDVGLSNVDNTADSAKNVLSATKWTTGRTLAIGSTGKSVDGSGNVSWSLAEIGAQAAGSYQPLDATLTALAGVTTAADKLVYATGVDTFTTTALTAAGRALLDDADAAAQRTTLGISATNTPSTAVGGIVATNVQAAIAELDSEKVAKVTSTDNAIARFDGTAGAIQNSGVVVDDSSNMSTTGTVQGTQLKSTIATGTAPVTVTSTTAVTNLNADLLDGYHASAFATSAHEHGDITSAGAISTTAVTPVNGDYLLISDTSASNKIQRGAAIGSSTTTYLRNDGSWATPPDTNTVYTHPTSDGSLHVPATSTTNNGKVLTAGASAGSFAWNTLDLTYLPDAPFKKSCVVATTANIGSSFAAGVITGPVGVLVIDGITVALNDRILVKDQTAQLQNGIYYVSTLGTAGIAWVLTRTPGANSAGEIAGAMVNVDKGTSAGLMFDTDFKATDTLNTTALTWNRVVDTGLASATTPVVAGTATIGTSINYARADHVHPAQTTITGNAATATKLAATKTISGVAFDGSANINIEDRLGTPIASATTTTIGTAGLGDYIHITGTTTITSFGTATTAGIRRTLIFDGILTLTHNATSLICIGDANIVTSAGMVIEVVAETTANWRVVSITKKSVIESKVTMAANNIDLSAGSIFTKTVAAITTFTVSDVQPTGNANSFILELTNGGAYAITWWSGIKWAGGTVPTLTASGVDILGFYSYDGGTTYRGIVLAKDSK